MLVRAAKKGESLYLFGGKVKIQVVSIQGSIVRLGFDTPEEVDVKTEKQIIAEWQSQQSGEEE